MKQGLFITSLIVSVFLVVAPATSTAGEWLHERDGLVLGGNLGLGSADINVTGESTDPRVRRCG